MSSELIRTLRAQHAFDSAPPFAKLARTHVPFDELAGTPSFETTLGRAAARGERIALVGATGSGKSSICAHVFSSYRDASLVPIQVRVDIEDESTATDPAMFAEHVVRTLATAIELWSPDDAAEARRLEQAAAAGDPVAGATHASVRAGVPWLSGELVKELGGAVRLDANGSARIEKARLALQILTNRDLKPVLVLDDTDHWFSRPDANDRPDERIWGFFGPVLRVISEDLGEAAAVLAVHDSYLAHPGYAQAHGFLETTVTLPRLQSVDAVGRVLASRATYAASSPVPAGAFIDAAGLDRLWRYYETTDNTDLRGLLRTVHTALGHADDADSDVISARDVEQGIDFP